MRRGLPLVLVVLSCACQKNTTTPSGTEVLRWDKSMATRASAFQLNAQTGRCK